MSIVDRIMLGQNKFLAIAKIHDKYYLISVTENNINILKELEDFQVLREENPSDTITFNKLLEKFKKDKPL